MPPQSMEMLIICTPNALSSFAFGNWRYCHIKTSVISPYCNISFTKTYHDITKLLVYFSCQGLESMSRRSSHGDSDHRRVREQVRSQHDFLWQLLPAFAGFELHSSSPGHRDLSTGQEKVLQTRSDEDDGCSNGLWQRHNGWHEVQTNKNLQVQGRFLRGLNIC